MRFHFRFQILCSHSVQRPGKRCKEKLTKRGREEEEEERGALRGGKKLASIKPAALPSVSPSIPFFGWTASFAPATATESPKSPKLSVARACGTAASKARVLAHSDSRAAIQIAPEFAPQFTPEFIF